MKKELIKLANHLDRIGRVKEANYIDKILKEAFNTDKDFNIQKIINRQTDLDSTRKDQKEIVISAFKYIEEEARPNEVTYEYFVGDNIDIIKEEAEIQCLLFTGEFISLSEEKQKYYNEIIDLKRGFLSSPYHPENPRIKKILSGIFRSDSAKEDTVITIKNYGTKQMCEDISRRGHASSVYFSPIDPLITRIYC